MSYIITLFKGTGRERRYRFRRTMVNNGHILAQHEVVGLMLDWFEEQPLARAMKGQGVVYAYTSEYESAFTVRDLTEDELVLFKLAAGPEIRFIHESKLRQAQKPTRVGITADRYKRKVGQEPKDPSTFEVVKRRRYRT